MAPSPRTPRTSTSTRQRSRPSESVSVVRRPRTASIVAATEPPPKRRRYAAASTASSTRSKNKHDEDHMDSTAPAPTTTRSRPRPSLSHTQNNAPSPSLLPPRRERSTRIRTSTRIDQDDEMQISSAAAVAAAVQQSEGYKPREERGWEEFHPNLDVEATLILFHADDVDGTAKPKIGTPSGKSMLGDSNDIGSPSKDPSHALTSYTSGSQPNGTIQASDSISVTTPTRMRSVRQSLYATRPAAQPALNTPTPLPIHGQNNRERLDLKLPSYRKTDRILHFESKEFGQLRYVDKAMMNIGYQESDNYIRPERRLIKAGDGSFDEEPEYVAATKADGEPGHQPPNVLGRVEYDMDEQDDKWLAQHNVGRQAKGWNEVPREVFEISVTKIEKEWYGLEKRIPKPNPKPPQTHRPRSSSAAAVNGEPQPGEEQDSKCAICDDGDCENTNAIVFCDGCDLAVHQECYGVPFIPEGQWLCRKCQLIGRGVPTCIFCPNSDGAFKQTYDSKWAHLICAMWIPEVTIGNPTFQEPFMDVDKVPKSRWRLTCYICNQQMGACIQCGNKSCYQAFHVTCARRARLFLRMKNSSGALDVMDGSTNLKALCDKHCPSEYAKENDVVRATKRAKKFYKKTMADRIWANSQAKAMALAATHKNAVTEHPPDESQMTGAKLSAVIGDKKGQPGKAIWKLPSGAPVIPQAVFETVEASLQRFPFLKRKEFVSDVCKYWTLKREMRRGAALLKRLQLQMETFSSMELTRRNFAAMGPSGKARLSRRIDFAAMLLKDMDHLKSLSQETVDREQNKLDAAEMERDFVDTCYFPIHKLLPPIIEKTITLDKNLFHDGLTELSAQIDRRFYTVTLSFARDLCDVINKGINAEPEMPSEALANHLPGPPMPAKCDYSDYRDRKKLGKRILKAVQPQLEAALRLESEAKHASFDDLKQELEALIETSLEYRPKPAVKDINTDGEPSQDVIMVDSSTTTIALAESKDPDSGVEDGNGDVTMVDAENVEATPDGNIEVDTSNFETHEAEVTTISTVAGSEAQIEAVETKPKVSSANGSESINTPPATNGYIAAPPATQVAPPTPPQSNGSLGGRPPTDALTDGGVVWYLQEFELEGTTAVQEQWNEREAVRSLSEELSEIDDDELKGLSVEVNESIMASPANNAIPAVDGANTASPAKRASRSKKRKVTYRRR
ncbi:hypothetical protein F5Y18DRAFT_375537 [Xylariaceae sp. FL1019]|nr:hypothetical protein F5Y18DRAFT_375537 [Xylariaceae sp. FL1019]